MTFSQGSRAQLTYVIEATFGTTPGSPTMISLPYNSCSLNVTKDSLESAELRSDRQVDIFRHGARRVEGDIEVDFRADDFDDFLEGAMQSSFDTDNMLVIGTTERTFSIEQGFLDIDKYRIFTGLAVSSMSMTVASNAMVTATFGFVGKDGDVSGTTVDSAPTDASGNQPYDGNNFIGSVKEGGPTIANVTSVEFTLENNISPAFVIGSATTPDLASGRARITGTITAHLQDSTLIDKFIDETESEFEFTLDDNVSGNNYRFWFPRIKYNGADTPVQDEGHIFVTLPFVALLDSVENTEMLIQKI